MIEAATQSAAAIAAGFIAFHCRVIIDAMRLAAFALLAIAAQAAITDTFSRQSGCFHQLIRHYWWFSFAITLHYHAGHWGYAWPLAGHIIFAFAAVAGIFAGQSFCHYAIAADWVAITLDGWCQTLATMPKLLIAVTPLTLLMAIISYSYWLAIRLRWWCRRQPRHWLLRRSLLSILILLLFRYIRWW